MEEMASQEDMGLYLLHLQERMASVEKMDLLKIK